MKNFYLIKTCYGMLAVICLLVSLIIGFCAPMVEYVDGWHRDADLNKVVDTTRTVTVIKYAKETEDISLVSIATIVFMVETLVFFLAMEALTVVFRDVYFRSLGFLVTLLKVAIWLFIQSLKVEASALCEVYHVWPLLQGLLILVALVSSVHNIAETFAWGKNIFKIPRVRE